MIPLVVATENQGKLAEFERVLSSAGVKLLSAREAGVTPLPDEVGSSYEENALAKAGHAAARCGLASLGDDSGLEVDALDGEPGLNSARFGGNLAPGERIAHLLSKLRKVPEQNRGARFVCVLVVATPAGHVSTFVGTCEGRILEGPRGSGGFGYDPVFFSDELGKSFAEASAEEKDRVSHRARALSSFRNWLTTSEAARLLPTRPKRSVQ